MTVTPLLISDPPLIDILGVRQPYTPRSIVETEPSDGVAGTGETYGTRDHPDEEIAAVRALADTFTDGGPAVTDTSGPASNPPGMRRPARTNGSTGRRNATTATTSRPWRKHPDWTQPPLPRW
ncbi:hypothetical protein [Streptomyces sp. SA15]|uniref:hypothetical protein n=1 Tax=Streptomyces sp. SA15 TaxID=934019 RepID=UPI00117DF1C0